MSKIKIVLIEDDDLICLGLRTALTQEAEIIWLGEAHSGQEGLTLLQSVQPDIAIIDLGLPDMDGIELTRQIKRLPNGGEIKILILTLNHQEESVLAAFSAGADSYCMKDIRLDLLSEALKATQAGNAWLDPAIARIVLSHWREPQSPPATTPDTLKESPQPYPLTERELEVLQLIVNGCSNAEIAKQLFITVGTVKTHVRNILNKLCADDRTQAAVYALRSGLIG